jgi:hypothetical protein
MTAPPKEETTVDGHLVIFADWCKRERPKDDNWLQEALRDALGYGIGAGVVAAVNLGKFARRKGRAGPRVLDQAREIIAFVTTASARSKRIFNGLNVSLPFHNKRHPRDIGAAKLTALLSDLAPPQFVRIDPQPATIRRRAAC